MWFAEVRRQCHRNVTIPRPTSSRMGDATKWTAIMKSCRPRTRGWTGVAAYRPGDAPRIPDQSHAAVSAAAHHQHPRVIVEAENRPRPRVWVGRQQALRCGGVEPPIDLRVQRALCALSPLAGRGHTNNRRNRGLSRNSPSTRCDAGGIARSKTARERLMSGHPFLFRQARRSGPKHARPHSVQSRV